MGSKSVETALGIRAGVRGSARQAIQMAVVCPPQYCFPSCCHWILGTYAICEESGEKEPCAALTSGTGVAKPPSIGTVNNCATPDANAPRLELNRTRFPSGVQPIISPVHPISP